MDEVPKPCMVGMEATMFTGWVYDHLVSCKVPIKVAHSAMLKALRLARRTIKWMPARFQICCGVTIFPNAIWPPAKLAIGNGCCGTGIFWFPIRMKNKVSGLLRLSRGGYHGNRHSL
jgi:hypothetical protein